MPEDDILGPGTGSPWGPQGPLPWGAPWGPFGADLPPQGATWAPRALYGADLLPTGATWAPLGPLWAGIPPNSLHMDPLGPYGAVFSKPCCSVCYIASQGRFLFPQKTTYGPEMAFQGPPWWPKGAHGGPLGHHGAELPSPPGLLPVLRKHVQILAFSEFLGSANG